MGDEFIAALQDAGLLPERTRSVWIAATFGDPVELSYATIGDDRLLGIAPRMRETDDPKQAAAK